MSATYTAGQKLRASLMAPQRVWTVTGTANTTATAAEAIVGTSPSTTYINQGAWRLTLQTRVLCNTATTQTVLTAAVNGRTLHLSNTSTAANAIPLGLAAAAGKPPLFVSNSVKVARFNADFLDGLANGQPAEPTFRTAQETGKVCDAVLASGKSGQWVEVG